MRIKYGKAVENKKLLLVLLIPFFLSACNGNFEENKTAIENDEVPTSTPAPATSTPVTPASQTIKAFSIPALSVGASVTLTTTASSGLTVSYASSTPNVCTVSGNQVTGVGFGTCNITATQAGSSSIAAAQSVSASIVVGAQTISFVLPVQMVVGETYPLTATASSTLPVTVTSTTPSVCVVDGGTALSVISSGNCTVTATQSGDTQYSAATPATLTVPVSPSSQTILGGATPTATLPQAGSTAADTTTTVEGIYSNAEEYFAFISSNATGNNFAYFDADGTVLGSFLVNGQTQWSLANGTAYTGSDASVSATAATASGKLTIKQSFSASVQSFQSTPSPLALAYDSGNSYAVSQATIAGSWTVSNGAGQATLTISSTGSITGTVTDSSGDVCPFTGTMVQADANTGHNLYNASFNITGNTTVCPVGTYQGLAGVRYIPLTSNPANGVFPELNWITSATNGERFPFFVFQIPQSL